MFDYICTRESFNVYTIALRWFTIWGKKSGKYFFYIKQMDGNRNLESKIEIEYMCYI